MVKYATIDEAAFQVKIDEADIAHYENEIEQKLISASVVVQDYLGSPKRAWIPLYETDTNGDLIFDSDEQPIPYRDSHGRVIYQTNTDGSKMINPIVKQATLVLFGSFWRDRDATVVEYNGNFLPPAVQALLFPLRRLIAR